MTERHLKWAAMFKAGADPRDIAARFGVQPPAVRRGLRSAGALPPYKSGPKKGRRKAAEIVMAGTRAVYREPCHHCGTRADIGCRHIRVFEGALS